MTVDVTVFAHVCEKFIKRNKEIIYKQLTYDIILKCLQPIIKILKSQKSA